MKRFVFWFGLAQKMIYASCRDCDFRLEFDGITDGGVILESCNTHDCLRDGN